MDKMKNELKNKNIVTSVLRKARKKKAIKPLKDAFKDVPVSKEIHKGKKEYFIK